MTTVELRELLDARFGGVLLDVFGFRVVFIIALMISSIAWWFARGMVEPRAKSKPSEV